MVLLGKPQKTLKNDAPAWDPLVPVPAPLDTDYTAHKVKYGIPFAIASAADMR